MNNIFILIFLFRPKKVNIFKYDLYHNEILLEEYKFFPRNKLFL